MTAVWTALVAAILGPRCTLCRERYRGWRTLLAHMHVDHAGDVAGGAR